jgi:hypothetical protein
MTSENAASNARAEFGKATSALAAARALDALGLYDDAASRLYYYAFHLISGAAPPGRSNENARRAGVTPRPTLGAAWSSPSESCAGLRHPDGPPWPS